MSDESPPRKVTSLRDRIAQFEQKPGAPAPPPKPAVPKKTWAWKEKQAEAQSNPPPAPAPAPAQPAASASSVSVSSWSSVPSSSESHPNEPDSNPDHTPVVNPGFSAADAKAAISAGGGLKARLAALQGAGLAPVGDPAASVPPPPPAGKPRVWKKVVVPYEPPPKQDHVLHSLPHDDHPDTTEAEGDEAHPVEQEAQEETTEAPEEEAHAAGPDATAKQAEEPDDEAEAERQRRAAIAARMARLGGARVGMPIAFGKPPVPTPPRRDSGQEVQPAARVASPLVAARKPSLDESVAQRESVVTTETEMTTEGSTAERSTTEEEQEPIAPLPSSPPRPRPPIPATRSWSQSPPASPKTALRPEVISQGSSFSIPRSVYEYPPWVSPIVPRASGGVAVADHIKQPAKFSSPIMSSPLSLSPISASPESFTSPELYPEHSPEPSPVQPVQPTPTRQLRVLSTRHSDSALRSSMITDNADQFFRSQFKDRKPQETKFGPNLLSSDDTRSKYLMLKGLPPPPPQSSSAIPPHTNVYPYSGASGRAGEADLNSLSDEHLHSPSSFYPRPLSRSLTPVQTTSSGRRRPFFRFFGWFKRRQLTDSFPSYSPHDIPTSASPPTMAISAPTPANMIKTKYQLDSGSNSALGLQRSGSFSSQSSGVQHAIAPATYGPDVISMNSPIGETAPPTPPKSKKIPPPRPPRPGTPNSVKSDVSGGSIASRTRRLQQNLRKSPTPPYDTKPSFDASDVSSLTRSASLRSNNSGVRQYPTLLQNHPPASNTLKYPRGDTPFPLPLPADSPQPDHYEHDAYDLTTPVHQPGNATWFHPDYDSERY